jgi:hypothetical protein
MLERVYLAIYLAGIIGFLTFGVMYTGRHSKKAKRH